MDNIELQMASTASSTINEIADYILGIVNAGTQTPIVIAVCGGTSTCKSSYVTQNLVEEIGPDICVAVELDNFQKGRESISEHLGFYGHDTPEYFEHAECYKTISYLKNGNPAQIPFYNYREGKQTGVISVEPKPVIIAEGLFGAYAEMADLADYIVYVESPLYARLLRRLTRNCFERYSAPPIVSFRNFFPTLNSHNDLIKPQKDKANAIIEVPYKFQDSIERFNLQPISAIPIKRHFLWEFQMSTDSFLGVFDDESDLFFCVVYENKIYFSFRISNELFKKLISLDMNSL